MKAAQRVGLIGLGSIGLDFVELVQQQAESEIDVVGAIVRNTSRVERPVPLFSSADELLARKPDVVVELAGHEGLREHGIPILHSGVDLLFVGVGALADPETEQALYAAAANGGQARIISGAIGALDAIAAAAVAGLTKVTHTTRKPPASLPGFENKTLHSPVEIFRGNAREAALKYPESINVAAAVSFAGIGLDRTEVVIMADPGVDRNVHAIEAEGAFGQLSFEIRNIPSKRNPRSARLVAMATLQQLRNRVAGLAVG